MTAMFPSVTVQSQWDTNVIAAISRDEHVTDADALRVIEAVVPVLQARHMQIGWYRAFVSRYGGSLRVSFIDKNAPSGCRSNPGKVPGLEVRIDPTRFVPLGHDLIR